MKPYQRIVQATSEDLLSVRKMNQLIIHERESNDRICVNVEKVSVLGYGHSHDFATKWFINLANKDAVINNQGRVMNSSQDIPVDSNKTFSGSNVSKEGSSFLDLHGDIIRVGQVMGYSMEGCVKDLENIIGKQGEDNMESKDNFQKSKVKWAVEGDENSKFFHGIINKRRAQLAIRGIFVDGFWETEPDDAMFIGEWSNENLSGIINILKSFFLASGLQINILKSQLLGVMVGEYSSLNRGLGMTCLEGYGSLSATGFLMESDFFALTVPPVLNMGFGVCNQDGSLWYKDIRALYGSSCGKLTRPV
ncbi:hypothetical protein Tco_1182177 [Tanacetum coccineum]